MVQEQRPFWWVRLAIEFEQHYGPFRVRSQAQKFADREKCETEAIQDTGIDGSYLELNGGEVKPPGRYIVFRSGRVLPFSPENLYEWVKREFHV
jgi:hypothetical protein